jgi:hypothetical protein
MESIGAFQSFVVCKSTGCVTFPIVILSLVMRFLPLLWFFSESLQYSLQARPSIFVQSLRNGDSIYLDLFGPGGTRYSAYFRVKPHFFYGALRFTITNSSGNFTRNPKPGDRVFFSGCGVTIDYSNAWSPCQITIFIVYADQCSYTIHARNQRSAFISVPTLNQIFNTSVCYFFEFQGTVHTKRNGLSPMDSLLIFYPSTNGSLELVPADASEFDLPPLFLIYLRKLSESLLTVSFSTHCAYSDWSDYEGSFVDGTIGVTAVPNLDDVQTFGLTTDRTIVWWVWLFIWVILLVHLVFFAFVLFWHSPPRDGLESSQPATLSMSSVYH